LTGKKKETYFDFHDNIIFIETKWPSKALDWKTVKKFVISTAIMAMMAHTDTFFFE
jgi:hypothetical protein